jgi:glutaminyl-tRNA synthetase
MNEISPTASGDFIRDVIRQDVSNNKNNGRVQTRFPPEPNGYLHLGHVRAIWINFGIAQEFGGRCNLRFDDTNPVKEEQEYIDAIIRDVHWLGYDWDDRLFYASDYFEQMYGYALQLVEAGKAYVDDLTAEQIREYRGTLTEPGKPSPYRNRTIEENLDLFKRMRAGEFPDGSRVFCGPRLIMASPNINMRGPGYVPHLHYQSSAHG